MPFKRWTISSNEIRSIYMYATKQKSKHKLNFHLFKRAVQPCSGSFDTRLNPVLSHHTVSLVFWWVVVKERQISSSVTKLIMSLIKKAIPKTVNGASVGIVGSGISGLTFAYFLSKLRPDFSIKILEKSDRSGGYINSKKVETEVLDSRSSQGFTVFEKGPRTLRGLSSGTLILIDLLHQFKSQHELLGVHKSSEANKKYLLSPHLDVDGKSGKLTQAPDSFMTLWRFLFDPLGRSLTVGLLKEPFVRSKLAPGQDESVEQFITRRFNKGISSNIVSALMHGVYSGDVSKLSVRAIFPKLVEIEEQHGSIIVYLVKQMFESLRNKKQNLNKLPALDSNLVKYQELFKPQFSMAKTSSFLKYFPVLSMNNGLETLPTLIAQNLPSNVEIIYNCSINSIENNPNTGKVKVTTESNGVFEFDHLRSTINSHRFADSLPADSQLAEKLRELTYSNMVIANVFIPHLKELPQNGFGFLVPKSQLDETKLLGVIFDSDVEQNARRLFFYSDVTEALSNKKNEAFSEKAMKGLSNVVAKRGAVITNSYTKVTLMIGGYQIESQDDLPSNSRARKVIRDVLYSKLNIDIEDYNGEHKYEVDHLVDSIPQYNVGYLDLKKQVWELAEDEFDGMVSFGGMSFGDGVGVPDCIMNAFKDAVKVGDVE